jgi:hypothetical protein
MNKDKANNRIKELKRIKGCLEFDLTCNGIINYGPIMKELDKVNAELKKLEEKYKND